MGLTTEEPTQRTLGEVKQSNIAILATLVITSARGVTMLSKVIPVWIYIYILIYIEVSGDSRTPEKCYSLCNHSENNILQNITEATHWVPYATDGQTKFCFLLNVGSSLQFRLARL